MIEVNLVPDVKKELIKAQQVRALVISVSIIATIAAVAITVLLALYVFGAQTLLQSNADAAIKDESEKLSKVEDLPKILTLQNQVKMISESHNSKSITSRVFKLLVATNPPAPNSIAISTVNIDTDSGKIKIEAQSLGGYRALETYVKTLQQTKLKHKPSNMTDKEIEEQGSVLVDTQPSEKCFGDEKQHRADVMCTQPDEKCFGDEKQHPTYVMCTQPDEQCFTKDKHSIYEKCLAAEYEVDGVGYGRDTSGRKVISFTVTFAYATELFDFTSRDVEAGNIDYENVTDSFVDIPEGLFGSKVESIDEGGE